MLFGGLALPLLILGYRIDLIGCKIYRMNVKNTMAGVESTGAVSTLCLCDFYEVLSTSVKPSSILNFNTPM